MATFKDAPTSYKDPFWQDIASRTEEKLDLPKGVLQSILLYGERSNADQVSSAGAKTPFQIIPQTRQGILKNYGIDPYLSPELAAEGAGLLIKESLDRNAGDVNLAIREYHGGLDRKQWGPINRSYVDRVLTGIEELFPAAQAQELPTLDADTFEMRVLNAYREGKMSQEQQQEFLSDVESGLFELPAGETVERTVGGESGPVSISYPQEVQAPTGVEQVDLPQSVWDAYTSGQMNEQQRQEFETDVASGEIRVPQGIQMQGAQPQEMGFLEGMVEQVTGSQRATPESRTLPEWTSMPELNQMSVASFKSALGTMLTSPQETVQVLQANFPDVQIRQDEKGNFVLRSPTDQQEYVIPPGFSMGDVPRAIGGLAAFTPAGRATSLLGAGGAAAGTQGVIEATQQLTGGEFSPTEVALAGAFGTGGQALARGAGAAAPALRRAFSRTEAPPPRVEPTVRPQATPEAPPLTPEAPPAMAEVPTAAVAQEAAPEAFAEVGETIRKASGNAPGSAAARAKLAEMAQVNAEARDAAERLGLDLPFDVFSDNPQVRSAVGLTRSVAGGEAEAAWVNTVRNATERADEIIKDFDAAFIEGRPSTAIVSDRVLNSLKKTRNDLDESAKALYNQVDEAMPKSTEVQMLNLSDALDAISKEVGEAGMNAQEKRLMKMLQDETVTYGRLMREKSLIGKAIAGKESPYGSIEEASLKRLYAAISNDQLDNVESVAGDEVRRQLRAANLLTAQKKGLENRIVSAYGKEMDGSIATLMQNAITKASKGDATQFNKMMKVAPEELRKEAVATALASVSSSGRAVQGGAFGFAEFTKVYRGLRANPKVYSEVVKVLGKDGDKVMRDLYEVSKRITDARAQVLTTGKANQALVDSLTAEGVVGKVMKTSMAQRTAGAAAATLGPIGGAFIPDIAKWMAQGGKDRIKAAADLFADEAFQKMVTEAATKGTPSQTSIRKTAMSKSFNEYAKKNGIGKSLEAKIQWLTTALQTGRQFGTEQEQ